LAAPMPAPSLPGQDSYLTSSESRIGQHVGLPWVSHQHLTVAATQVPGPGRSGVAALQLLNLHCSGEVQGEYMNFNFLVAMF
jgi:hypothetical protein